MEQDQIAIASADVIGQRTADEAVLLLPARGEIKVVNMVGARIWELIDGTRTVRQIAAVIHAEFEVSREQAEHDVGTFVGELVQRGMCSLAAVRD